MARAELEDAKKDLALSEKSIDFLNRSLTEVERGKEETLVDSERFERALDTETLRSLHRYDKRDGLKREKTLLQEENRLLRGMVQALEAKVDDSFGYGYFFASHKVA